MMEGLVEINILFGGSGGNSHRNIVAAVDAEKEGKFKVQAKGGTFRVAANQSIWEIAA